MFFTVFSLVAAAVQQVTHKVLQLQEKLEQNLSAYDFSGAFEELPPFFGRADLFQAVEQFALSSAKRVVWLEGDAGTGKSSFVKALVSQTEEKAEAFQIGAKARVAGYFLCQHDFQDTLRASTLVSSFVVQMVKRFPSLVPVAAELSDSKVERDPFSALVLVLRAAKELQLSQTLCFVIDSLDEALCSSAEHSGEGVVDLLEKALGPRHRSAWPSWLRLVVTTRQVDQLRTRFSNELLMKIEVFNQDHSNAAVRMLASGRVNRFVMSSDVPASAEEVESRVASIVQHSRGVFLWAVLVLNALEAKQLSWSDIGDEQFLSKIPTDLSQLYREFLSRTTGVQNLPTGKQRWGQGKG